MAHGPSPPLLVGPSSSSFAVSQSFILPRSHAHARSQSRRATRRHNCIRSSISPHSVIAKSVVAMAATTKHELLRALLPQTVLPDQYNDRSRALTLLKRIDYCEIRETIKRNGHRFYVIGIHYKLARHRIPQNNRRQARPLNKAKPDAQVLHRFSEFNNLCDEMYFHAHSGHPTRSCAFCGGYMQYVTVSATQPRVLMKLLHTDDQVRKLLERFLNDVLRMIVTGVKAFGGRDCYGQDQIPVLLLQFLLPDEAAALPSRLDLDLPVPNGVLRAHEAVAHSVLGM